MSGTKEGGRKAAAKNIAREPNFYSRIGKKGGSAFTSLPKGFAANRELAAIAGKKGGRKSRRVGQFEAART
jgi:general stress protein YciG